MHLYSLHTSPRFVHEQKSCARSRILPVHPAKHYSTILHQVWDGEGRACHMRDTCRKQLVGGLSSFQPRNTMPVMSQWFQRWPETVVVERFTASQMLSCCNRTRASLNISVDLLLFHPIQGNSQPLAFNVQATDYKLHTVI